MRSKRIGLTSMVLGGIAALGAAAAGVGAGATASTLPHGQTDSGGAITVWVDAPRVPGVDLFIKTHPSIKVNLVTIATADSSPVLEEKFVLDDQAGKGWPDAIFWPDNGDIAWASSPSVNFAANLSSIVPKSIQSGYDSATIAPCMVNGQLKCLRNDTAADVFWYNAKLFKKWGYTPPATWEQYETLGIKIAKAHPGYVSGLLGDGYATGRYLWASGCPISQSAGQGKALINLKDPRCTRVESMLNSMLAAKALTTDGIFDSSAAALGAAGKIAMTPGAVWYGAYLFQQTFKVPSGEMTASKPLYWATDKTHITGDEGGGLYSVSSHITGKELANTITFVDWMVSAAGWQVDLSTGLPAWGPDRSAWLNHLGSTGYFADFATMKAAILSAPPQVVTNYSYLQYDPTAIWDATVPSVIDGGGSFASAWSAFGSGLTNKAQADGYKIVTSS